MTFFQPETVFHTQKSNNNIVTSEVYLRFMTLKYDSNIYSTVWLLEFVQDEGKLQT